MSITLYHHPYSRAATAVWYLEEVGQPYELRTVDIMKGAHKAPDFVAINPMGKLPTLTDGDTVVTELAAIALYLGDRYGYGTLAPKVDDPARGAYLRWSFFTANVLEPGFLAKNAGWTVKESQVGWGNYNAMLETLDIAVSKGPWLLGETFTMADCIVGGLLRFGASQKMFEPSAKVSAYIERIGARPAMKRTEARNAAIMKELGLSGG